MKYIIGMGWWCDGSKKTPWSHETSSSDELRSLEFFDEWYYSISRFTSPTKVIVINNNSPYIPDFHSRGIEVINMTQNINHPAYGLQRTAATRQSYLGAWYSFYNDADFFVWVEQDCLLYGKYIIEMAISHMGDADYSMAQWNVLPVDTGFMVFRCSSIRKIQEAFLNSEDNLPEIRYWNIRNVVKFVPMPFGYGRQRPVKWTDEHFFIHQASPQELARYRQMV